MRVEEGSLFDTRKSGSPKNEGKGVYRKRRPVLEGVRTGNSTG